MAEGLSIRIHVMSLSAHSPVANTSWPDPNFQPMFEYSNFGFIVDMGSKATLFSEEAGGAAAVAALVGGGWFLLTRKQGR